jgi:type VI protein secretion system component VasK
VRWFWGILVAVVLIALMPVLQAVLEFTGIVPGGQDELWFHAFAIEVIVLLCVLIFRRQAPGTKMRVIRPRLRDRDED